ncbi:MAG: hypothetical protein HQK76_08995 [Desulfobacterales bacterium]|nr:hypothetical protein [Desulfobacterales bacterium]
MWLIKKIFIFLLIFQVIYIYYSKELLAEDSNDEFFYAGNNTENNITEYEPTYRIYEAKNIEVAKPSKKRRYILFGAIGVLIVGGAALALGGGGGGGGGSSEPDYPQNNVEIAW